eukprot:8198705-Ditylum_brightwellii.AAC.1
MAYFITHPGNGIAYYYGITKCCDSHSQVLITRGRELEAPSYHKDALITTHLLYSAFKCVLICIAQKDEAGKLEALSSASLPFWMLIHCL